MLFFTIKQKKINRKTKLFIGAESLRFCAVESFEQKEKRKFPKYVTLILFSCVYVFFKVNSKGCWLLLKKLIHSQMLNVLIETMTLSEPR